MTRPAAMVLAAGLGTRLAPLTEELPKPLVWLGDRPLIDTILLTLARAGYSRVVVNTHHLPERFDAAWRTLQPVDVTLVHEPRILGTGGGISNAAALLGEEDALVWNADIFADVAVPALLRAHDEHDGSATLVVGPRRAVGEGTIGLDKDGRVVRVRAFDAGGEVTSADYAGIAVLRPRLRDRLPAEGCLVGDALIPALEAREPVATFQLDAPFFDLGTLAQYLDANLAWLAARGLRSWAHPRSTVEPGVQLDGVIVASDAHVAGQGRLERVVVWPGATATAPLADAIVTPRRVMKRDSPLTK